MAHVRGGKRKEKEKGGREGREGRRNQDRRTTGYIPPWGVHAPFATNLLSWTK